MGLGGKCGHGLACNPLRVTERYISNRFSYVPNLPPVSPVAAMGAAHGFALVYVFAHVDLVSPTATAKDKRVMANICTYWTNSAKFGNPNGLGLPKWPTFTSDRQRIMKLGVPLEAGEIPAGDLRGIKIWHDFYAQKRNCLSH